MSKIEKICAKFSLSFIKQKIKTVTPKYGTFSETNRAALLSHIPLLDDDFMTEIPSILTDGQLSYIGNTLTIDFCDDFVFAKILNIIFHYCKIYF